MMKNIDPAARKRILAHVGVDELKRSLHNAGTPEERKAAAEVEGKFNALMRERPLTMDEFDAFMASDEPLRL